MRNDSELSELFSGEIVESSPVVIRLLSEVEIEAVSGGTGNYTQHSQSPKTNFEQCRGEYSQGQGRDYKQGCDLSASSIYLAGLPD